MSTAMLDLNSHCGGTAGPNAWENPNLTGMHRLPPHAKNVRRMAKAYYNYQLNSDQRFHPAGPQPCVCLDSPNNIPACVRKYANIIVDGPLILSDGRGPKHGTKRKANDESIPNHNTNLKSSSISQPKTQYDDANSPMTMQQINEWKANEQAHQLRLNGGIHSKNGWKFRLFPNPMSIPQSFISPSSSSSSSSSSVTNNNVDNTCTSVFVPSCWTLDEAAQQFSNVIDPPRYTNVQMPFDILYPHVPTNNPTGVYRLEFSTLPSTWVESQGIRRRVILHLGGVESCFFVYMNSHFVGMGKDSRLPSEFDITPYIHHHPAVEEGLGNDTEETNNTLVVIVLKWSDSSFLEQQDHWRGMAGIHRSMFLYSTPAEAYIEDVFCQAEITKFGPIKHKTESLYHDSVFGRTYSTYGTLNKGRLKIQARIGRDDRTRISGKNIYYNEEIECTRSDDVTYRMVFQLFDMEWKAIFDELIDPTYEGNKLVSNAHFRSNLISFYVTVPKDIYAWSDESPILYRLRAILIRIDMADTTSEIDVYNSIIGFRNVEVADRKLLVNGQPILIKGVNRHDHSSTRGKANSLDEISEDLRLMKEFNFNAIRTAHYPNDPYLYELADKLGLYVIDEANIECHGHYDMICREHSFASAMLDRVQRMVVRDQNHPCIIGWSLGNEAGYSYNQKMLYGWIKGYDTSRFVQYEGANRPVWGQLPHVYNRDDSSQGTDIICPMYSTIEEMVEWADVTAPSIAETRPFIMCEYAHAMGNSSGSLSDYWKVIKERRNKGLQGGFIWDWCDQGLEQIDVGDDENNELLWQSWHKYGGDYGDEPSDRNFNINGMISPSRNPHPAMHEFKKCVQPVDFLLNLEDMSGVKHVILEVFNLNYFSTLDDLIGFWSIKIGGFVVKHGTFPVPEMLLPQISCRVRMNDVSLFLERSDNLSEWVAAEIYLDVSVATRKSFDRFGLDLSNPSICVATEQFPIHTLISPSTTTIESVPRFLMNILTSPCKHVVDVKKGPDYIHMLSNNFTVKFIQGVEGFEYVHNNGMATKRLVWDVHPNLFRAATDNDGVKQLIIKGFNDETKPLGKWLKRGLDRVYLNEMVIDSGYQLLNGEEFPSVTVKATIFGCPLVTTTYAGIKLAEKVASTLQQDRVQHEELGTWQQQVTMHSSGSLFVETKFDLRKDLVDLPRVGLRLSIPAVMSESIYFADGLYENYSDRRLAAHAGVYRGHVSEYPQQYVVPQEQGNRMNMRWLVQHERHQTDDFGEPLIPQRMVTLFPTENIENIIANKKGVMIVSSGKLLQFTSSRCTDTQIFTARHARVCELQPSKDSIYICLDAAQRGLGTGSCGPQTRPEYQVNGGKFELDFWIKPVGI